MPKKRLTFEDTAGCSDLEKLVLYYTQARNELEAALEQYKRWDPDIDAFAATLATIDRELSLLTAQLPEPPLLDGASS